MGFTFDVNLSILFTELPLLERPGAAASAGFEAVELWWPFAEPVPAGGEADRLVEALVDAGTRLVALNFDAGDMARGERGLLSLPAQAARLRDNVEATVALAERTGCRVLNALYGNRDPRIDPAAQDDVALENLLLAAAAAERIGAFVVVEALNALESPRYPIISSASALGVVERARAAGAPNVAFLADLYHLARMGESLDSALKAAGDRLGHVQIADVPGRNQPGSGELGPAGLLGPIQRNGYSGWVGLEYRPTGPSAASFAWLKDEQAELDSLAQGGVGR